MSVVEVIYYKSMVVGNNMVSIIANEIKKIRDDRELIFGYCGIAGLFISLVGTVITLFQTEFPDAFIMISVLLILVNFLNGAVTYHMTRRYDKLHAKYDDSYHIIDRLKKEIGNHLQTIHLNIDRQKKIATILHNFTHEYRKQVNELHADLISKDYTDISRRNTSFRGFLSFMTINIKEIFDILTEDECSVSIKLIDENLVVRTLFRDSVSYRERSNSDKALPAYRFSENTAFFNIFNKDLPDSYFLSNNLEREKTYKNANPQWRQLYNACIVEPIRIISGIEQVGVEESRVLGFICVDNFHGGFEESISVNVLACFSDLCYHLFSLFFEFKYAYQSSKA
ncbi:MAG: hypothetical protein AB1454_06275 [Candidatus Auribacterota bacterium]